MTIALGIVGAIIIVAGIVGLCLIAAGNGCDVDLD